MKRALILVAMIGCGGGEPGTPDGGGPDAAGPDLTTCATWTATPAVPVTATDHSSSMFPQLRWIGGGYGLVWYDERAGNDAFYAELAPDGAERGGEHEITTESTIADSPVAAWSGAELGVAWEEFRDGNFEIYAARIGRDGTKLAPDVNVSRSATASRRPTITAAPDGWTVGWVETSDGIPENEEIELATLSTAGATVGDPVAVTEAPGSSYAPAAAVGDGAVRIAWHDQRTGSSEIWTAPAADPAAGASLTTTGLVPSLAWGNGAWGVVYHDLRGPNWTIHVAVVDPGGGLVHETQLSSGDYYATFGSIVWAGTAWVVTWQEHTGSDTDRIMARRVGLDGTPIGDAIVVVDSPRVMSAQAAAGGGDIGVVWQDATVGVELRFARVVCAAP